MKYLDFLHNKIAIASRSGFDISDDEINPMVYPHQRDIIKWAIAGGRRAIFAAFGLGKTFIQLEVLRIIKKREGGPVLILCPLGVKQEFKTDATKLGLSTEYVKSDAEVENSTADILLTNYERVRDGGINPEQFTAVSLDEASVLRGYGTKTYQSFLHMFPSVKYRFVATATPSPNRFKELIHYAGFLGIMDTGEALTRFFQRDSTKANQLTIYPHMERQFWGWMSSWSVFIHKPSDLGYSDEGYDLPAMNVHWHKVTVDHSEAGADIFGQFMLFRDSATSLQEAAREKRRTMNDRIRKACEIMDESPDRNFILWHDLEDERRAIKKAVPDAVDVYGSQDLDEREKRTIDFSEGRIKHLATKPKISGSGCNFQRHCADEIFVGITYKFNDFIQAIHRVYRFLQDKEVNIHIIYAESEEHIVETLKEKWERHNELQEQMISIIQKYGLSVNSISGDLSRSIGVDRIDTVKDRYTAVNNDCVVECGTMDDNSVDMICTSIPFGNHYEYSPSYNDFGHSTGNEHFFTQMDYLTPELHRVLKPGRVAAIHVKDRILFGNTTGNGMPSVDPFHMHTTLHFQKHGFIFIGMITIETDVVRENNQTYRLGWTECCKDGSKMGVGCPEYLLLFRKLPTDTSKAYADEKVTKSKAEYSRGRWQIDARAKWNSSGDRFCTPDEIAGLSVEAVNNYFSEFMKTNIYDYDNHIAISETLEKQGTLPATFETLRVPARDEEYVWEDVSRMRTLNGEQVRKNLVNHICPLQFDIVDRCIRRFTNKDDLVFDPFAGIMTVPYRAVMMGRRGLGTELNYGYYRDGLRYLEAAELKYNAPTLFDLVEYEDAEIETEVAS